MKKTKDKNQADELRRAMLRLGLTKRAFAGKMEVSPATVDAWIAPESALRHRRMKAVSRGRLAVLLAAAKRK